MIPTQMNGKSCGLYFHIPFCRKKCDYCHFYVIPDQEPFKEQYMKALSLEWEKRLHELHGYDIRSIYFGGGTPSLLGPDRIGTILSWIKKLPGFSPDIEITLEANPEDAGIALIREYATVGINRCSLGIQSLDDGLLKTLSRLHNAATAKAAVFAVKEAGIDNISIDLMYDLPGQKFPQWEKTLEEALSLPVTHLSIYNLVFEPHTVFYKKKGLLSPFLPDEETSAAMYREALVKTQEAGFLQYEISAFEKPGCHSRHNRGYWEGRSFLGFGPSAFSYWNGVRFRNHANLGRYAKSLSEDLLPVDFEEGLKGEDKRRELLAVRLRLMEGVDLVAFQQAYGDLNEETRDALRSLEKEAFLISNGARLRLTDKGILFYDTVASEII